MSAATRLLSATALVVTTGYAGCRAIDGLDGYQFDLSPDGGLADTSCAAPGDTCIAVIPAGWSGPVAIFEGPPGTEPACPASYPKSILDGGLAPTAQPATCSACNCADATPTCTPGALTVAGNPNCKGNGTTVMPLADACTAVTSFGGHLEEQPPTISGGCLASGGKASRPPIVWATRGLACAPDVSGEACAGCAPRPPAPFAGWCIWRTGVAACPASFPEEHAWSTALDQRDCTPCACSAPGATCTVTTSLFGDAACKNHLADLPGPNQCITQSSVASVLASTTITGSPSCTPSGGAPTGSVEAEPLATICCAP